MIVAQYPPKIHTAFNPALLMFSAEAGETIARILITTATLSVERKREFFNGYATFDISEILRKAFYEYATLDGETPTNWDGSINQLFNDRILNGYYNVTGWNGTEFHDLYDGETMVMDSQLFINAVVQLGMSSDFGQYKGNLLTKLDKIKLYDGYPQSVFILPLMTSKTEIDFVCLNDHGDPIVSYAVTDSKEIVTSPIIFDNSGGEVFPQKIHIKAYYTPDFTVLYGTGWTFDSGAGTMVTNNNNYNPAESDSIPASLNKVFAIKFNALVSTNYYRIEIFNGSGLFSQTITNGSQIHMFTIPGVYSNFKVRIYGINASSGSLTISDFSIADASGIDLRCIENPILPENPFYIRWINRQGGRDYWMFGYRQFLTKSIANQQTFKPVVINQLTAKSFTEIVSLESVEKVKVGVQGLSKNEFDCISNLVYSPLIEWFNESTQSWQRIFVDGDGSSDNDTHNILKEIEFTFLLPTPQLQF